MVLNLASYGAMLGETVHSGHFMISSLTDESSDTDSGCPMHGGSIQANIPMSRDFIRSSMKRQSNRRRRMLSNSVADVIDGSLVKLLKCMTLDYSGRLPSPKWKNFNGIKVKIKDKIRLNNVIWREWYRQFKLSKPAVVCQFDMPLCDRTHLRPEAVVLEGKYWKRRLESVTAEYKKWRRFYMERALYSLTNEDKLCMEEVIVKDEHHRDEWSSQRMPVPPSCKSAVQTTHSDYMSDCCKLPIRSMCPPHNSNISLSCESGNLELPVMQLGVPQHNTGEMMDTLTPLPSQQYMDSSEKMQYSSSTSSILAAILTDRRPLTTLATFSSCLHSEKLSPFENSLSSLCDTADYYMTGSNVTEPYSFVPCVTCAADDSRIFSSSSSTWHMQPFSSQAEQCSTRRSENPDGVRCTEPVVPWVGTAGSRCNYNAIDYRTACDRECWQAVCSSQAAYTSHLPLETTAGPYQRSSYQSVDWKSGYQSVPAGHSTCSRADAEETKDLVSCSQLSASISTDQLPASDQSSDTWSSGVSAKKIKQVRQMRTEHGRRTTQAASRRASTGSLLCTTAPDPRQISSAHHRHSVGTQHPLDRQQFVYDQNAATPAEGLSRVSRPVRKNSTPVMPMYGMNEDKASFWKFLLSSEKAVAQSPLVSGQRSVTFDDSCIDTSVMSSHHPPFLHPPAAAAAECQAGALYSPTMCLSQSAKRRWFANEMPSSRHDYSPSRTSQQRIEEQLTARQQQLDQRRVLHLSSEKKRRNTIKNGFEKWSELIACSTGTTIGKTSKAVLLQHAVELCTELKLSTERRSKEFAALTVEKTQIQSSIDNYCATLPSTGAAILQEKTLFMSQLFTDYVESRMTSDWRFCIFILLLYQLFESFVSRTAESDASSLTEDVLSWVHEKCCLACLRPLVSGELVLLSKLTSVLENPSNLQQEVHKLTSTRITSYAAVPDRELYDINA